MNYSDLASHLKTIRIHMMVHRQHMIKQSDFMRGYDRGNLDSLRYTADWLVYEMRRMKANDAERFKEGA